MNRRPVVVAPLVIALAACLDATGVGTEVAQITLSAHSDTVWTIGARTRIVATALDARGNAVPVAGAEWSSTRLDVATVEPGFASCAPGRIVGAASYSVLSDAISCRSNSTFVVRSDTASVNAYTCSRSSRS